MYIHAQFDKYNAVVGISELSSISDAPNMKLLCPDTESHIDIGWRFIDDEWLEPIQLDRCDFIPIEQANSLMMAKSFGVELTIAQEAQIQASFLHLAGIEAAPNSKPGEPVKEWQSGEFVTFGAVRMFNKKEYACRQAHVTQTDWPPDATPALWILHRAPAKPDEILPWVAGETVAVDDRRIYDSQIYACILAHTTQADWTPPKTPALWRLQ